MTKNTCDKMRTLTAAILAAFSALSAPFKDGDRVVFFGDSITHGGFYGEYVNLFYATRYPERNIWFSNSGWSGATAQQGLWSIADDIVAKKPTVVTVMFGMNDINRDAWPRTNDTPALAAKREGAIRTYDSRMDELVRRVRAEAGNPEIIYFTPSPYDQTCLVDGKPSNFVCNDGLAILADHVRSWAARDKATCVDLQGTMAAINADIQKKDPSASLVRGSPTWFDRVHPGPLGHTVMLYEILKAQGAESCVDEIERDANGADALTFACTEKSLPFPMTAEMRGALGLVPFEKDFNREILRVRNLKEGRYAVKIDGIEVGVWTAAELAEGVNLALNEKTPQYRQAAEAAKICQKLWAGERMLRNFATRRRWMRMHYKIDPDAPGAVESLLEKLLAEGKSEDSYEVRTYREYLKNWPRHAEFESAVVKDRAALAEAVRPRGHEFKIEADARIEMGAPFTDGAILQRGMSVPVWGRVAPRAGVTGAPSFEGRKVKVSFAGQEKTAAVGADGKWKAVLDPMAASKESRTMKVCELGVEHGEELEIKDVLVGEVWFASGQSNMECPIWGSCARYRDMKGGFMTAMTRLPNVRYVKCERKWAVAPCETSAKWRRFMPENLRQFNRIDTRVGGGVSEEVSLSAVAFYYARELYLALDVPVGIDDASWGGTNIDAWTPRSGYDGCDESIKATADYPVSSTWNPSMHRGVIYGLNQQPTVLWNGMVAAFAPMAMRGFIWYQGCNNSGEPQRYCAKLHALYNGWRREFCNPGLKMYLAQLAPHKQNWMGICMAQTKFCAEEENAALAVTSDAGNFWDIHPNDKEIVAQRLALHALKRDYGFDIPEDDSPVLNSAAFKDGKAVLSFDNVKGWYVYARDYSRSPAFELAGKDGVWHDARIENFRIRENNNVGTDFIDGPDIVLSAEAVPAPEMVRYMGKPMTSGTLYNESSLPLGPFEFVGQAESDARR